MSFKENALDSSFLIGNVELPRNLTPTLRAYIRRSDPDGTSTSSYYPGLTTKKLDLEYTDASLVVQTLTITFTSSVYSSAISAITNADVTNLEALDLDGFLAIKNRNSGSTHYIKVLPQSVGADEAASILGFRTWPFPTSVSYAGELSSTPGVRSQKNPQGTAFIGKDEDITSAGINRALAALINLIQTADIDLMREVVVTEAVDVTLQNNSNVAAADGVPGGSQAAVANVFSINDTTLRIPVGFFTTPNPGGLALQEVVQFVKNGTEVVVDAASGGGRYRIASIHYSTAPTTAAFRTTVSSSFTTWGTPDNKSVFGILANIVQKDKQPIVAITAIRNNIITCSSATFVTNKVQPGDTCRITGATSNVPFNHNGEFLIEQVWDETTISVRAKSINEPLVFSTENRPTELNTSNGFGSVTVPIGYHMPARNLVFTLERVGGTSWGLTTAGYPTASINVKVARSLKEVTARTFAREFNISSDAVISYMDAHIASGGHPATAITATAPTWTITSESVGGTNVQTILNNIIAMLSDNETGTTAEFGSSRVGSAAITGTAPDNTPRSLVAGSIKSQLKLLLEYLNNHINDNVAHSGGGGTYSGSPNWDDGTSIAAGLTLDAAIDRIVTDLGGSGGANGADKVHTAARTAWLGGRTNPSGSVFDGLDKIITDLAVTTAGDDGAERIGAQATGDLTVGSVRSQLDYLAANWGKLSRANTWSATQTLNGASGDTSPSWRTDAVPSVRKLIFETRATNGAYGRWYMGATLMLTYNARYVSPTGWIKDIAGASTMIELYVGSIYLYSHPSSTTPFSHNAWKTGIGITGDGTNVWADLDTVGIGPTGSLGNFNAKNIVKAWGTATTNGSGGSTSSGIRLLNVSISGTTLTVNLDTTMTGYTVTANVYTGNPAFVSVHRTSSTAFQITATEVSISNTDPNFSQVIPTNVNFATRSGIVIDWHVVGP
jgi:hypothetical protein